jgi:hypothetical protein
VGENEKRSRLFALMAMKSFIILDPNFKKFYSKKVGTDFFCSNSPKTFTVVPFHKKLEHLSLACLSSLV